MSNKIRSKNSEMEKILTLLETMAEEGLTKHMNPEDFGVDSIYYYKKSNDDPERKHFFKKWLKDRGYRDVTIIDWKYSPYDIYAKDAQGNDCVYELKCRDKYNDTSSTDYGDSIIDENKYNELSQLPYKVYIVNFFTDAFYIHSLDSECESQHYPRCRANMDWDRHIVSKYIVSYNNKNGKRYEYN